MVRHTSITKLTPYRAYTGDLERVVYPVPVVSYTGMLRALMPSALIIDARGYPPMLAV